MANYGMSNPIIAQLVDETKKTYRNAFQCGEAVNTAITANYATGKLYGDNRVVTERTKFKDAAVTLGVTTLPVEAEEIMFGREIADGVIKSKTGDKGNTCGYGFVSTELIGDTDKYVACVLYKVIFAEGTYEATTGGENIEIKSKNLTGNAYGIPNSEWRDKKVFDKEQDAYDWIAGILGLKENVKNPVPTISGGEYHAAQTVKLSCVTAGATIKYTTDGTTPSEHNGNTATASTSINISATTGLRFFAYKEGCNASPIVTEEYFITTI